MNISKEYSDNDFIPQIDAVISYVNAADKYWQKDFSTATGIYSISGVRFRSWGTLKYLFRGIETYMPFVRRIILIVSRESQIPSWVNRDNVRIVLHKDFIPKEFLPTFNSCTIESFLYRIPDLSEKFIYFNDDMFPIATLGLSDFFKNNTPVFDFHEHIKFKPSNIYECQCRCGLDMIASSLKVSKYTSKEIAKPEHSPAPMLKSTLDKVGELCSVPIFKSISQLRQKNNVNQYIYTYYQYFTNTYIQDKYRFVYSEIKDNLSSIKFVILHSNTQMICLNDSDKITDYKKTKRELLSMFEEKFPNKCKYEM